MARKPEALAKGRWRVGAIVVHQRSGTHWHYYCSAKGKRHRGSLHTEDLGEALKRAQDIDDNMVNGRGMPSPGVRLGQLTTEFWDNYAGWSARTRKGYKGMTIKFLRAMGNRPIRDIKPLEVERWLRACMTKGSYQRKPGGPLYKMHPSTRNRYVAYVRKLFDCAVDWGWLEVNHMKVLKQIPTEQKIPEALTTEQLDRLLAHLSEPAKTIIAIAADTGIRRGALYHLRWEAVDFDRRLIQATQTKGKKERYVPMTNRVFRLLVELRQQNRNSPTPTLTVLPNYDVTTPLKKAAEAAQVGHVHFHMFRHTCATRLLEAGTDIRYVQEILGHSNLQMTARYAHVRVEKLHEAFRGLEAHEGGQ